MQHTNIICVWEMSFKLYFSNLGAHLPLGQADFTATSTNPCLSQKSPSLLYDAKIWVIGV